MSTNKFYSKRGKVASATDAWLEEMGYYRKNVAYDETCLFRAVSEQLFYTQIYHERVRKECIQYAKENYQRFLHFFNGDKESFFEHLEKLSNHMIICGNVELEIISLKYNRDIKLFDATEQTVIDVTSRNTPELLLICRISEDHFDVIYECEHIATAGFCQSIVYKILYENVFNILDVDSIVKFMLYDKPSNVVSSSECFNSTGKLNGESSSTNSKENESESYDGESIFVAPFPFKIAKALDPTIYRNIEYDTWTEIRREMRLGDWYYGDHNLILGTSCIYKCGDERLQCYIQDISKEENKCTIYIISLAERRTVNYSDLLPEDNAKPWPLPYRFSKNLVISPAPAVQTEKDKKIIRKRKDKKRPKNLNIVTNVQSPRNMDDIEHNIHTFEGCPLVQMHLNNQAVSDRSTETDKVEVETVEKAKECQYTPEPFQWPGVLSANSEPVYWPHTPVTPQNIFTFNKPVCSATTIPLSPEIPCMADNGVYFYNYNTSDEYTYDQSWTNNGNTNGGGVQISGDSKLDISSEITDNSVNPDVHTSTAASYVIYPDPNQAQSSFVCENVQTNLPNIQPSPQVYPAAIYPMPLPQPAPMYYASPELKEVVVPQHSPLPIYTPPIFSSPVYPHTEVQFVAAPYLYPPTPPAAWYSPGINSQGFIYPSVASNVAPNGM